MGLGTRSPGPWRSHRDPRHRSGAQVAVCTLCPHNTVPSLGTGSPCPGAGRAGGDTRLPPGSSPQGSRHQPLRGELGTSHPVTPTARGPRRSAPPLLLSLGAPGQQEMGVGAGEGLQDPLSDHRIWGPGHPCPGPQTSWAEASGGCSCQGVATAPPGGRQRQKAPGGWGQRWPRPGVCPGHISTWRGTREGVGRGFRVAPWLAQETRPQRLGPAWHHTPCSRGPPTPVAREGASGRSAALPAAVPADSACGGADGLQEARGPGEPPHCGLCTQVRSWAQGWHGGPWGLRPLGL